LPTTGEMIGIWVAMALTFAIYSFLYKDNPVFKFAEHVFVGVSTGYGVCYAFFEIIIPDLVKPLNKAVAVKFFGKAEALERYESLWLVAPAVLGIFMLLRFVPKLAWLSRWSFAFIIGAFSGIAIPLTISAYVFKQMGATMIPLSGGAGQTISAVLILIGVISVLSYFFFSLEHKGPMKPVASVGIYFIMVSFGAAFGYTIMARQSLAIQRFQTIVKHSKSESMHASMVMLVVVVVVIAALEIAMLVARKTVA
jgi:hypothetical protein